VRRGALIVGVALALGGCADLGATTTATTTNRPSQVAIADRTHEYPAAPAPTETVAGGGATAAQQAIREFATAYINWTAGSVARDMLVLAAESVGQARSATELAASETASDYELRRGGVANSGTVQAVAPLRGGGGRFVVVTLERTTATNTNEYAGLAPAWHVTVATATELSTGKWVVSGWQPEN
jgi:hypothetical protein